MPCKLPLGACSLPGEKLGVSTSSWLEANIGKMLFGAALFVQLPSFNIPSSTKQKAKSSIVRIAPGRPSAWSFRWLSSEFLPCTGGSQPPKLPPLHEGSVLRKEEDALPRSLAPKAKCKQHQ